MDTCRNRIHLLLGIRVKFGKELKYQKILKRSQFLVRQVAQAVLDSSTRAAALQSFMNLLGDR